MDGSSLNSEESAIYRSYLLRMWQEGQAGDSWRASLQSASTGERQGFASLDSLFDFIRCEAASARTGSPSEDCQSYASPEKGGDASSDQLRYVQAGVTTRKYGFLRKKEHEP